MRDLRDGYTTFLLETKGDRSKNKISCSGHILQFEEGEEVIVQGKWDADPVFGAQLKEVVVKSTPLDKPKLLQVILRSGFGIGVIAAQNIVEQLGEEICGPGTIEEGLSDRLMLIRGINRKQADGLTLLLKSHQYEQELYEYMLAHGGVYKDFLCLYKRYGSDALEMLRQTPYDIGRKSGIKFVICDSIAKENGEHGQSAKRLEYGVRRALQSAASEGHTYLEKPQLLRATQRVLRNAVFPEHISLPALSLGIELAVRAGIVKEGKRYYLPALRKAEKRVAENIGRMSFGVAPYEEYQDNLAETIMEEIGISFAQEQKNAFSLLRSPGIKVLLGGPGTGKTTVVRGLVEAFLKMKPKAEIILCAPTGRAAQRLAEATGREAYTIHRLLEFTQGADKTNENLASKALQADFYVVDESSMINIELADTFLNEIQPGATVLFVGDDNQLPAIGAGNFLHDITHSEGINSVELTEVFRQKDGSATLQNARAICMGISRLSEGDDFHLMQVKDETMLEVVKEEFVRRYDAKCPYDVQVLAGTRGLVTKLNHLLQKAVNPNQEGLRYGGQVFRTGDKVIMNNNNYKMRYFNGDVGIITGILSQEYIKVQINQVEILLTIDELDDMELGYAITVHKSQGSEYPVVFVVLPAKPKTMLRRKILFTAISRGKKEVRVFAQKSTIAMAVANNEEENRQSTLIQRLKIQKKKAEKGAA